MEEDLIGEEVGADVGGAAGVVVGGGGPLTEDSSRGI